jgi:Flp pilus assembly protein TadG
MVARLRQAARRDDGASAVEFALVLPILVLLLFGIISFGLYFAASLGLSNASREAARYGVVKNVATVSNPDGPKCSDLGKKLSDTINGTIGIVYPISFTLTRGTVSCTGSIAVPVGGNPGVVTLSTPDVSMCKGSTPGQDELIATTTADSKFFIPAVDISLSLTGKGSYRCEFS